MRRSLLALCLLALPALAEPATRPAPLPVHMLVPGFTVRELPVQLTNLNNLAYGPDRRLYAVGYDGRVHVLVDADHDGLEETVLPWSYDHAADMRAPVGMVVRPEGMYVASKGRVSLLRDTTGSGKADHYEVVVGGWTEIKNNVDALGVAVDAAGNLYYGRGAESYRNPLLTDKDGVPHYDLKAESGTVIKVSPDRKTREVIATGIRFTVALAINREGDLFATDQEGATWVPNGNPLDKIEQIIPGRHYGFPPKSLNPEYLKSVVDEPPVVAFGPQHQSSCGMKFNERTESQPSFGPDFWEGDALVAGESRGKLWRCPLVKTPAGYVGKPVLIASLDMLTLDVVVSPAGDLLVCCHSGKPDWGTGPKGAGRVFKISYTGRDQPQPVIAWPASATEVRVAFDKPLDPFVLSTAKVVVGGKYTRAADRLEILKPPYAAVKQQEQTRTTSVRVVSQALADEGRTLVLRTDPLPWQCGYAVAVPGVKAVGDAGAGGTVDVDFSLHGVVATNTSGGAGAAPREYWTPHLTHAVNARHLTGAAAARAISALPADGTTRLRTLLKLDGSRAYFDLSCNQPCDVRIGDQRVGTASSANGGWHARVESDVRGPLPFELTARGGGSLDVALTYHTDADPFERPVPLERLILPWAVTIPPAPDAPVEHVARGDWSRGKALFYGDAKCGACHTVRGQGGTLAPDLSNLTFKDPDAVLTDIVSPSAAINPDYVSYNVKLKDGTLLTGVVAAEGDQFAVMEGVDKTTNVRRADVTSMTPSAISIMPEGFKDLGPEKLNDLLEFLTGEPPKGAAKP